MLLIGLGWAGALAVALGLGLGLARLLRAGGLGPLPAGLTASPELLSLTGLAALAWLVAGLSFGLPVALPMQLLLSALAAGGLWVGRAELGPLGRAYAASWRGAGSTVGGLAAALAAALTALVLAASAQPPAFPDAALYHAQFVQWLHAYPLVPGLGNLHGRLAFNSHAHLLTAFFSPAGLGSPGPSGAGWPAWQQLPTSLSVWLLALHHVRRAAQHLRPGGRPWLASFYLGTLLLLLMALRPWLSSPLPDLLGAVLGLALLGSLLETPRGSAAGRSWLAWLAFMAASAVTVKASAALLLLWPLAWAWRRPAPPSGGEPASPSRPRRLGLVAGVALLTLLPWLGRNIGLAGYAAYPLGGGLGPLAPDWTVPPARRVADLAEIRLFARRPLPDWPRAAGQPLRQWLPGWWHQQEPADQRLLLLGLAGAALVTAGLVARPPRRWWRQIDYQLYGLLLLGSAGWFGAAPALRFGYPYLIGAAGLGPLLALRRLGPPRWGRAGGWALLTVSLLYCLNGLRHELARPGALAAYLVWPAAYPAVRPLVAGRLGPYVLRQGPPPRGRCGNCPLPCTDTLRAGLTLRGPTLRQGFRTAPGAAPDSRSAPGF